MDDSLDLYECVVMNLMIPVLLSDSSTFLAWIGSGRQWYGSLFLLTKPQLRQLIEALLSMRALVMMSLLKVFFRTDWAMQNDFDCLSATITLLKFLEFSVSGESSFSKILYIEFSDKFLFIAYLFSFLDFQDFFNFCYSSWFLLGFLLRGFCVGVWVMGVLH